MLAMLLSPTNKHTHTHIYIYIKLHCSSTSPVHWSTVKRSEDPAAAAVAAAMSTWPVSGIGLILLRVVVDQASNSPSLAKENAIQTQRVSGRAFHSFLFSLSLSLSLSLFLS